MSDRVRAIAQELAEQELSDYDFYGIAENQEEWDLTDAEAEEVFDLIVNAKVTLDD